MTETIFDIGEGLLNEETGEMVFTYIGKLIRCRDCRWYRVIEATSFSPPVMACDFWGRTELREDDYCSRAKMRES